MEEEESGAEGEGAGRVDVLTKAAVCELLIGHGARLDAQSVSGRTALHAASQLGHAGCVKLLLEAKTSVDVLRYDECVACPLLRLSFARCFCRGSITVVLMSVSYASVSACTLRGVGSASVPTADE